MLPSSRHFVNRNAEITQINSALSSEGREKNFLILVHGQKGIGKTELLAHYQYLLRSTRDLRIAYVDLHDRDYMGLISEVVEGLGSSGFEDLGRAYDGILLQSQAGIDQPIIEHMQEQMSAIQNIPTSEQKAGMMFLGPVTAEGSQTFINGPVTISDPKIKNIINIHLNEPKKVEELNQKRITLAFQNCLSEIAKKESIVLLFDHWENASDPLKIWLNNHLLKWASQLKLKKALIILSREVLPNQLEGKVGILTLSIPRFSRDVALEFWVKNELPVEEFDSVAEEVYGLPGSLVLEVGMWRFRRAFQGRDTAEPYTKDHFRRLVVEFLQLQSEQVRRIVRFSSIPNAFSPELIQLMCGKGVNVADVLEMLREHSFIHSGQEGWYYYSSEVREILYSYWQQPERSPEYQEANRIAIEYFEDRANETSPPEAYFFQREALHHRLREDEKSGLEYMANLFEHACDQRQLGAAQGFALQLGQLLPFLSPIAAQYALYYEIRMDFLLNQRDKMEERLEMLVNEATDTLLKARASILLGQVYVANYEWRKSVENLNVGLEMLKKNGAWPYAARAMLALGDVYLDLVENSGGTQSDSTQYLSWISQFLTRLLFLPFLVLDWLRRKIWFLPGWFYFGGNYQEWIINYLLQMGGKWYRKAWHMAQNVGDDVTSLNALLGQANVAVEQRREAKAERIYSRLARLPAVNSSRYRMAQVLYGKGQVSLMANQGMQASRELQSALSIFRSFADEANIGMVARTLGTTHLQLADNESAAKAFLESFQAYRDVADPVSQTQVSWEMERLIEEKKISSSKEEQIKEALSYIQEKHYVARFPTYLLRRFRSLASWISLPLSYLLILLVGMLACLSLIVFEHSALQFSSNAQLSQSDIFFLIVVGIVPIFASFWIIELVYAVVGQAWVLVAGHLRLNSLGEQPDRIILTSEAIEVVSPGLHEPIRLAWNNIQKLISADYKVWRRPIHLFSRQGLAGNGDSIIVDGITSGYLQLRREIEKRIGGMAAQLNADTVILAHPTTYIAILFALFHAQLLVMAGKIDITVENIYTGEMQHLLISRLLVFILVNIIMIFPPLILWRVNLKRRYFSQELGKRPRPFLNLLSFGIAIILTIVALLWLGISPFLTLD